MSQANTIYLKDYQKPDYLISKTELTIEIFDECTRVSSRLHINKNHEGESKDLILNGENLSFISLKCVGEESIAYDLSDKTLSVTPKRDDFILEIVNEVDPKNNKALEGLYQSGDIYCTQNEPEGFRKICYYLDRSDVMSVFTTRIEADKVMFPRLLSNGNLVDSGAMPEERHYAVWEDPFPKPCYLFALVAGDLAKVEDKFITKSGRSIPLQIFVDHGNEDRCDHALESLKKSMKWDEDRFGLEYDLDLYMIVAVDAFNMGAMENKGLNIFNSTCALANPETATDANFFRIESIIAHEYFHNWTGNRVTCRDWFQLTLKEGLTVFRDQEFSADLNSRAVCRIEDVRALRDSQFVEDAGPNAHPIKPSSYMEINNFYTPTVYEKGAEVIRMIHTMIGEDNFQLGMKKYFDLFDGQAVATEDFVHSMEVASGRDFKQFKRWYSQSGTPIIKVDSDFDQEADTYTLTFTQKLKNVSHKAYHLPVKLGLLSSAGEELELIMQGKSYGEETVVELHTESQSFVFEGIKEKPVASLFRGFSAPIILDMETTREELAFLLSYDSDSFNRYEAGQRLAKLEIESLSQALKSNKVPQVDHLVLDAFSKLLRSANADEAFKALAFSVPSLVSITEQQKEFSPGVAQEAREILAHALAEANEDYLSEHYNRYSTSDAYVFNAVNMGLRSFKNMCLAYLLKLDKSEYVSLAQDQYDTSANLTDRFAALLALLQTQTKARDEALEHFYDTWEDDAIVINKWFAAQASSPKSANVQLIQSLEKVSAFDIQNPNKVRCLYGAFAANLTQFHKEDGSGYSLIANKIIELNSFNPQIAAGLSKAFKKFGALKGEQKDLMKQALETILEVDNLSPDVYEIVSKTLKV
ncbi:aminopeptidase N [Lentisphaera profundi]|uniref:Aminopeptidase N n=1 Tax=Lentisphaera profundi TaxID=1658616 RepID=A0ABY7VZQ4_9BACT|nr:aminopeptidase N [Lentisphaera profundi]WDE99289.1 aminopeptidase N [Lentisphaera profundi]